MSQALIIGGGLGGIACALRLRAKGYEVEIIDQCERLGGRAQIYEHQGFCHDAGPTVITAPFLFEELFQLFGKNINDYVRLVPLTPWYRFVFADGEVFNYGGTFEDTLEEIHRLNPPDVEGYKRLVDSSRAIFEVGFAELADEPFHQFSRMLRTVPDLMRLKSYKTVWQLVCDHLQDERLRQAFSIQPLLVGGNPFDTTSIYSLIHYLEHKWGVHFVMGGTGALIDALSRLLAEEGVQITLNQKVTRLHKQDGRIEKITLDSGEQKQADIVVSNADPTHLYQHMLPASEQAFSTRLKTRTARYSMGLFVLYFGTTRRYEEVAHHTIWLAERYRSLLEDIFHHRTLAEDFSLYVHRPTATDERFAPEGCDAFYVLAPVPNMQADIDWQREGPALQQRIISALDRTLLPGLSETITAAFFKTPNDFAQQYSTTYGTGFTIAPYFSQSAWFRYHNRSESAENLYLVGAGTHPGAGLPGVLNSAKIVEKLLA